MRLDKFLKLTRLVKRRTLANTLCDLGGVSINDKVAKAASAVAVGQILTLRFGNRHLVVEILGLPTRALGNQTEALQYVRTLRDEKINVALTDSGTQLIDDD